MPAGSLNIPILDLIIIVAYLFGILAVGILSVRRLKLTSQVYFLAGRSLRWGVVGAALFASNISTIHLVGLAASGYNEGLVWGNFEWMATFTLILLGLVFAPFYFKSRISTLPEFLERRYGPASRIFLAFMAIVGALFIHIGMSLYAGAAVFKSFFGIDVVASIVIISAITAIYTVLGGLKAVVVTETIQTVILILGAILVTVFAILALPDRGIHTLAGLRAAVKPSQLSMIHTQSPVGLTWYAVLLGYPILGIWYWCSDQTIVQRVLGARSQKDAQLGPLLAGGLKILPVFIMVFPGVLGYVLFRDLIGSDSNQTLPVLINQLIPTGLKGLISAGLLAALMSTIAAALNSSATLVAVDIVKRWKPAISDEKTVLIGRVSAVVVMLMAMVWSTQGGRYSSIFEAINAIASHLAPRNEAGLPGDAHRRVLPRGGGISHRPPHHRIGKAHHPCLGHSVHDAGLVDVLPVQPHLRYDEPADPQAGSRPDRRDDLEKSLPRDLGRKNPGSLRSPPLGAGASCHYGCSLRPLEMTNAFETEEWK